MDILWKYFGIISFKRLNLGNSMEVYYMLEILSVILQNYCGNVIIFRNIPEISQKQCTNSIENYRITSEIFQKIHGAEIY